MSTTDPHNEELYENIYTKESIPIQTVNLTLKGREKVNKYESHYIKFIKLGKTNFSSVGIRKSNS